MSSVRISYPGRPRYEGGTISYDGNQTVHTFTSSGSLTPVEWQPFLAVWPRRINGRWYWFKSAYRRLENGRWRYGDAFDVLRAT